DSGDEIWRFYNGRASMENYIKESKNGFGSDQVSGDDFYANFADLWLKMIAYNIHILFCKEVCGFAHSAYTIARFRRTFFEIPAKLVTHARQWKLKNVRLNLAIVYAECANPQTSLQNKM